MKTSIIAFVFSALIGVGFHYSAYAAPKKDGAAPIAKPAKEEPKEEPAEEEAEQPAEGGSGDCKQLMAEYIKAEEAADDACEKSERSTACKDASKVIEELDGKLEQNKCEWEEGEEDSDDEEKGDDKDSDDDEEEDSDED